MYKYKFKTVTVDVYDSSYVLLYVAEVEFHNDFSLAKYG